ncbi:MAG: hypothetical protein JSW54_04235, partial [Fidelibacterota bacterium]
AHIGNLGKGAFMALRVAVCMMIMWGSVRGISPGEGRYPDPSLPVVQGLFGLNAVQNDSAQPQDSLGNIDINSPYYRYPGKAMMMSLALPGAGQLYVGHPKRTVVFLGAEILAILVWNSYARRGEEMTQAFRDTADAFWDFRRWLDTASLYGSDPWGTGDGQIYIGTQGSHHLEFFVEDMDGDEQPEFFGNTKDDSDRLDQLLLSPDTSRFLDVKRSSEYYENIGKYNQFFSGWDDADPDTSKSGISIEERTSGLIALTPHRSDYLEMREETNRLKRTASYAISALMFNHVVSAVDAIFATSRWNREHASRLSGRLLFNPACSHGIGGLQITLTW